MDNLIKGTTPTFQFTFDVIDPSDITSAYLTVKQGGAIVLEKDISSAVVGDGTISWQLTQYDTLHFSLGKITVMLNWLTENGIRGATPEKVILVEDNHKDEVIG